MNEQNQKNRAAFMEGFHSEVSHYMGEVLTTIKQKIEAGEDVPEIERVLLQIQCDMMTVVKELGAKTAMVFLNLDPIRWPKVGVIREQIDEWLAATESGDQFGAVDSEGGHCD